MIENTSTKYRQAHYFLAKKMIWFWLRLLVLSGLSYVVYTRLIVNELTFELVKLWPSSSDHRSWLLMIVIVFAIFINWGLESKKWQILLAPQRQYTLRSCFRQVTQGISVGLLTPARVGEYGGRILGLKDEDKMYGVQAHFVGSLSQNIINVAVGLPLGVIMSNYYLQLNSSIVYSLAGLFSAVLFIMLVTYLGNNKLFLFFKNLLPQRLAVWKEKLSIHYSTEISLKVLSKSLYISLVRYLIFSSQFVMLLYFYGADLPLVVACLGVGLVYLLQSGLPLPPVLSIFARGELAIIVWSSFVDNAMILIAATFTLWILNLLVPAIGGGFILGRSNI